MVEWENKHARIVLKKGRARSVNNFHPWVFSGAVERVEGAFEPGDIVAIHSFDDQFQAKGFINPKSKIFARIISFEDLPIDRRFWRDRLQKSLAFRHRHLARFSNAYRMVNSDADGLPGLIVDRYQNYLVIQMSSLGMYRLKSVIIDVLRELVQPLGILERSESASLADEGLSPHKEVLWGNIPDRILIQEYGIKFWVDVVHGQKTGFFLDQRENRWRIGQIVHSDTLLLNCFAYTGAFSVYAALRGAQTVSVDVSEGALELARENFRLNGLHPDAHRFVVADVFDFLREMENEFTFIILDPPAFIKKKHHIQKGARGYKDINRLAMKKICPDGCILTCSCSHYMNWELFQKVVFAAAREAERHVQILGKYSHPADHPISIYHPEGEYLKACLLRVL